MKLVSYRLQNTEVFRIGCIEKEQVFDLQESYRQYLLAEKQYERLEHIDHLLPNEPSEFFSLGEKAINRAKLAYEYISKMNNPSVMYDRNKVILGPPIPKPGKIICVGRNYVEHAQEMKGDIPDHPVLFAKF